MTEIKVLITEEEADAILKGEKMYLIRDSKIPMRKGYFIRLQTVRGRKEVLSRICRKRYEVTYVDTYSTAPITEGMNLISLREVA